MNYYKLLFIFPLFLLITSCGDFDSNGNYTNSNPINLNYNFKSEIFLTEDYKIIKYSELEHIKPLSGIYISDLIFTRYFIVLDFDNFTYTFIDNNYYIDSYFSNGEDLEINTPEYKHEKSTLKGNIIVKGSVIYFDFLYNKTLSNANFDEQYYPAIINIKSDKLDVDVNNKNRAFSIYFYGHKHSSGEIFYINFTKKTNDYRTL